MPSFHSLPDLGKPATSMILMIVNTGRACLPGSTLLSVCRNCIGQEFAMNEMLMALAHILHKFEISLDESKPIKKDFLATLKPKPGLFLKLKNRINEFHFLSSIL